LIARHGLPAANTQPSRPSLISINDRKAGVTRVWGKGSKERTKMTWRVSRTLIDFLLKDTEGEHNPGGEIDPFQQEVIETYRIAMRRGLTPSDALAVAIACKSRRLEAARRDPAGEAEVKH
jgi:hypothetical protein